MANDDIPSDKEYAWRTCKHEDAVFWNPFNKVVQCHSCGWQFIPAPEQEKADDRMAWLIEKLGYIRHLLIAEQDKWVTPIGETDHFKDGMYNGLDIAALRITEYISDLQD